jgi:1,4-dihydroxy-2-naphthoate octaprenyltransferase
MDSMHPSNISRHDLWTLLLHPSITHSTAAVPLIVAGGLGWHDHVFAPVPLLLGFFCSWLVHVAGVFMDKYMLLRLYPDLPEHPQLLRALKDGTLSMGQLRFAILVSLGLALIVGVPLLRSGGIFILLSGLLGVAASLNYAGGIIYAKHGWAELIFFLTFGELGVVAAYAIQVATAHKLSTFFSIAPHSFPLPAFVVGLPTGALVAAVLVIDDMRDHGWDRIKGWHTTGARFGVKGSRMEFTAILTLAYVAPFCLLPLYGPPALLPLLSLPFAYHAVATVRAHEDQGALGAMHTLTSLLSFFYAILQALGMVLSRT